jgi:hypothetical protein
MFAPSPLPVQIMAGEAAKAAARRRRQAWKVWGGAAAAVVAIALLCRFLLWRQRGFAGLWDGAVFAAMCANLAGTTYLIGVGAGDEAPASAVLGGSKGTDGQGGGLGEMVKDWFLLSAGVMVRRRRLGCMGCMCGLHPATRHRACRAQLLTLAYTWGWWLFALAPLYGGWVVWGKVKGMARMAQAMNTGAWAA